MTHIIPMWLTTIIIAILVFSFVATQIYLYFKGTCTVGSPLAIAAWACIN